MFPARERGGFKPTSVKSRSGATPTVGLRTWIGDWRVYRQLAGEDKSGLGAAVRSSRTSRLRPRVEAADSVVRSVCPYCAVGCGQTVFIRDGKVV